MRKLFKRLRNALKIWARVNSIQKEIVPFRDCWKLAPDETIVDEIK